MFLYLKTVVLHKVEEIITLFCLSGCLHTVRTVKTKLQEQDIKTVYPGSTWGVPLPHVLSGSLHEKPTQKCRYYMNNEDFGGLVWKMAV